MPDASRRSWEAVADWGKPQGGGSGKLGAALLWAGLAKRSFANVRSQAELGNEDEARNEGLRSFRILEDLAMWRVRCVVTLGAFLGLVSLVLGEEQQAPADAPASEESQAAEIDKLVEQLDAERFSERQAASRRLAAIGKPAIDALAKAAVGESLEATIRSIDLLRDLLGSADQGAKDAARAALEEIAKSDREAAARRAKDVLQAASPQAQPEGMIPGGAIQIFGGGIQFGGRRISVKNVNGVRDIEVDENDRKIKIHDDPRQAIKVEVTTKKDGKDVTQTYEAKNADELKKKHPEAHKLYQQYAENQAMGAVQIQIQANALPGPVPVNPQAPKILAEHRVRILTMTLQSLNRQLEAAGKVANLPDAPQATKDELKKQMDELKQRLAEMEKRLAEKPEAEAEAKPK